MPLRQNDISTLRFMLDMNSLWMLLPWGVHFEKFMIDNVPAEWIAPPGACPEKVMMYLHGGGYALGSSQTHRSMVGKITQHSNIPTLLVGYRKIPESQYPAALEDALKAYDWLLNKGYAPENIVFGGDSAGGGLALATMVALRDTGKPLPAAGILLSPWTDLTVSAPSFADFEANDPLIRSDKMKKWGKIYAGDHDLTHPWISPAYADLTGLPPLLIQVSETEALLDDSLRIVKNAREAGVEVTLQTWNNLMHWWHIFWHLLPEARSALRKIGRYQKAVLYGEAHQ